MSSRHFGGDSGAKLGLRCGSPLNVSLFARCPLACQHFLLILTALPVLPQLRALPASLRVRRSALTWNAAISAVVAPEFHLRVHARLHFHASEGRPLIPMPLDPSQRVALKPAQPVFGNLRAHEPLF